MVKIFLQLYFRGIDPYTVVVGCNAQVSLIIGQRSVYTLIFDPLKFGKISFGSDGGLWKYFVNSKKMCKFADRKG